MDAADHSTIQLTAQGKVEKWLDKSGSNNDAFQDDIALQPSLDYNAIPDNPFKGHSGISFNASQGHALLTTNHLDQVDKEHVFIISKHNDIHNTQRILTNELSNVYSIYLSSEGKLFWSVTNYADGEGAVRDVHNYMGTPRMIYGYRSIPSNFISLESSDRFLQTAIHPTIEIDLKYVLGRRVQNYDSHSIDGQIFEVLIYHGDLSTDEIASIKLYLNTKWALKGGRLPQNDENSNNLPDTYEAYYELTDAHIDDDGDTISNLDEFQQGTHPKENLDTDLDGLPDDYEIAHGFIVGIQDGARDKDGDTLSNALEFSNGYDLFDATDTEGDGMPDDFEIHFGLDLAIDDSLGDLDQDGMTNIDEFLSGTQVNEADAFSPPVQDLVLWLDASDLTTLQLSSQGTVKQWLDKSGQQNNATQHNLNYQPSLQYNAIPENPLKGHSGVGFNKSAGDFLYTQNRLDAVDKEHVFIAAKHTQVASTQRFLANELSNTYSMFPSSSSTLNWSVTNYSNGSGAIRSLENVVGAPRLLYGYRSGLENIISLDSGGEYTKTAEHPNSLLDIKYAIGSRVTRSNPQGMEGTIFEVLIYHGDLSPSQVQAIQTYLDNKWSLKTGDLDPTDLDANGLPDAYESFYQLSGADADDDNDAVSNLDEYNNGTHPSSTNDIDTDGIPDDFEIASGFVVGIDDADGDLDGNGVTNREEYILASGILQTDLANEDAYQSSEGQTSSFDVLSNDHPLLQGVAIILSSSTSSEGGSIAISENKVTYTSALHFSGSDTFEYSVLFLGHLYTAEVEVTVAPINEVSP